MSNHNNKTKINEIIIKGARENNLKNIDINIPKNKLVVITGLSGSGKSSLAFDTIYAEGQRRYVESLSSYARQFLDVMDKPEFDQIDGLSPAIAIDQRSASYNPRSTVGTVTNIYDFVRLLYSKIGHVHCPECGVEAKRQTLDQVVDQIYNLKDVNVTILAPIIVDQKGTHKKTIDGIRKANYYQVRFDGIIYNIEEIQNLDIDKNKKHTLEVVVDRVLIEKNADTRKQLTDSVRTALDLGNGKIIIQRLDTEEDIAFSQQYACPKCNLSLPDIELRSFSFNSPYGACPKCTGLGSRLVIDPKLIIPNPRLTLAEGAVRPWSKLFSSQIWYKKILEEVGKKHKFSVNTAVEKLKKKDLEIIYWGTGDEVYEIGSKKTTFEGIISNLEKKYKETDSDYVRKEIERYMRTLICPECNGKRLKPEVLAVTVGGLSIHDVVNMSIENCQQFFIELLFTAKENSKNKTKKIKTKFVKEILEESREMKIAQPIAKEIILRLDYLKDVGLSYLKLDRSAMSLSGGEAQRTRLATQIGSSLSEVIYVLDEPSIGLHQRDNLKLVDALKKMRDLNNTVLVVEHDTATMLEADQVIDIGPGAGKNGGKVIAQGTPEEIMKDKNSVTGKYLAGQDQIEMPDKYRSGNGKNLTIVGAKEHNLKNINVNIPLGKLVCVTGVSGSGKSTLITDILSKELKTRFYRSKDLPGKHKQIKGVENIDKVINIDQSPIGRTPRSNPATYTGVFTYIRDLFTQVPEAKMKGYGVGHFSFNVKGGRCEACHGDGLVKIEMQFLPDVYVECEECKGKRYNKEILEVFYRGKNIADVLEMTVEEARTFFADVSIIHEKLTTLYEVGLGYLELGQSATTLSGGEAQRIKLATELSRYATGKTLYILDEPTTGLHLEDIKRLLTILNKLVDKGNTVLVIEHNLDLIKVSDWIIDLGPEGGDQGGELVAQGTPADVSKVKKSYTGQFLKEML